MKKTLKTVAIAAATMITTGAMASVTKNMENPLYTPKSGEFYSKTGLGLMYKKSDHTNAMRAKGTAGDPEFPVYRATEDFGYGFSDSLTGYASLGYTHNGDIDRKGMHRGRLGLNYRVVETLENFIWDIYGEGFLSGVSPMKGSAALSPKGDILFKYDNFSNGRWGGVFGTQVGKKWSKLTTSVFFEYLQTFGNHNNEIDVTAIPTFTTVDKIAVDLKSTNETTIGINAFYQTNDRWSFGGGFRFVEHADNGVKSVHTKLNTPAENYTAKGLLAKTKDMDDGWHEYILSGVLANQVTDYLQLALVGEYTFDFSHPNSQNGTDVKMELGVRANVRF